MMDKIKRFVSDTILHAAFRTVKPEYATAFNDDIQKLEDIAANKEMSNQLDNITSEMIANLILVSRIDEFVDYSLTKIITQIRS